MWRARRFFGLQALTNARKLSEQSHRRPIQGGVHRPARRTDHRLGHTLKCHGSTDRDLNNNPSNLVDFWQFVGIIRHMVMEQGVHSRATITTTSLHSGVTIIVPHYGDPAPTARVARMLLDQDYPGPIDIVVVDDGSPQPAPEMDGVKTLRLAQNSGFGKAVNAGVESSSEQPLLLILNSDTEPASDFVRRFIEAAREFQPAVCGVSFAAEGIAPANTFATVSSLVLPRVAAVEMLARRSAFVKRLTSGPAPDHSKLPYTEWVSGAAMLLPRRQFVEVGGFDEDFFMYWEDVDLQYRLQGRGIPSVWIQDVSIPHVGGASSSDDQRRQWGVESSFVYFAKRGQATRIEAAWTSMIVANLIYDTINLVLGRGGAPMAALRERSRNLRLARRKLRTLSN